MVHVSYDLDHIFYHYIGHLINENENIKLQKNSMKLSRFCTIKDTVYYFVIFITE